MYYGDYRFSISLRVVDPAARACLHSLAEYSQRSGNRRMVYLGEEVGGTCQDRVTYHFTQAAYRDSFLSDACRLLPRRMFQVLANHDNDPVLPQF